MIKFFRSRAAAATRKNHEYRFVTLVLLVLISSKILLGAHYVDAFVVSPIYSSLHHITTSSSNKTPTATSSPLQLLPASTRTRPARQHSTTTHLSTAASIPSVALHAFSAWVPWKQVGVGLLTIPNRWALYSTCFIACHLQILWPLAVIRNKKSSARISLGVLLVSILKIMFGPPWVSFLVMCYSMGLFIWSDFVDRDGGPPLPPFIYTITGGIGFVAALSAMGVFPVLSASSL